MGGDGREYRVYGLADLLDARLRFEAEALLRQRFVNNLYSPWRLGTGLGGSARLSYQFRGRAAIGLGVSQEWGRGWRAGGVSGRASFSF